MLNASCLFLDQSIWYWHAIPTCDRRDATVDMQYAVRTPLSNCGLQSVTLHCNSILMWYSHMYVCMNEVAHKVAAEVMTASSHF